MLATLKKSGMRLKASSENFPLSALEPHGEKNFFEFYRKHSASVEQILTAQINRVAFNLNPEDRKDLHQDVLFRLHRCNIISRYDSDKAGFNTYLTGTIIDYVKTWIKEKNIREHHSWKPFPSQFCYMGSYEGRPLPTREMQIKVVPFESRYFNAKIVFLKPLRVGYEVLGVETRENGAGSSIATRVRINNLPKAKSFSAKVTVKLEPCKDKKFKHKIVFEGLGDFLKQQGLIVSSSETTGGQGKAIAIRASLKKGLPVDKPLRYEREFYSSLNGVNSIVPEDISPSDASYENEYDFNELVERLRESLPSNLHPIFDGLTNEMKMYEIAGALSVPPSYVSAKKDEINRYGKRLMSDCR